MSTPKKQQEVLITSIQHQHTKIYIEPAKFPEGIYAGSWSGYIIMIKHGETMYKLRTNIGIRGLNEPCKVSIKDGIGRVLTY